MKEQFFTIGQCKHEGYSAPGGHGVHHMEDEFGTVWEIHFHPEHFDVYRRWTNDTNQLLLESVKQADAILKGEAEPSRTFVVGEEE